MSIATKGGDHGQTSLMGGVRVSKTDLRVECCGAVDELNAALGLARSFCRNSEIKHWTEEIQRTLFRVAGALAVSPEGRKPSPRHTWPSIAAADVDWLTEIVHAVEGRPGILSDWSIPGALTAAAAYDVARTVCRRAERHIVRLLDHDPTAGEQILPYMNRLSDALWLFGRVLEVEAGINSALRGPEPHP